MSKINITGEAKTLIKVELDKIREAQKKEVQTKIEKVFSKENAQIREVQKKIERKKKELKALEDKEGLIIIKVETKVKNHQHISTSRYPFAIVPSLPDTWQTVDIIYAKLKFSADIEEFNKTLKDLLKEHTKL